MTQINFGPDVAPQLTDLDSNFTELYSRTQLLSVSSGVLGVGVTPSAWWGGRSGLQIGSAGVGDASLMYSPGTTNYVQLSSNIFVDSSVVTRYVNAGPATFYAQGSGVHSWGSAPSGASGAGCSIATTLQLDASGNLCPGSDNVQKFGIASLRWSTVYAGTGTINTSDAREKSAVTPLSASEIAAAQELVSNIGIYQWLSAVQAKGEGDARKHVGMTVQQAITVMTSHGLDPMAYGFICYDSWAEEKDADGNVTLAAGDRYSFRPDELGMFIARGVGAALEAIQTRLHALDGQ